MHMPDLLSGCSFLTWGRLRPAHMNVMLYGWASMAGIGTAIWLMARLSRTTLRHPLLLGGGRGFWNLGVLIGVIGILAGQSTGYEWLEFPPYAAVILFVAYSLVISWAILMFRFRRERPHLYHAMVSARRVSLVPVALWRHADHAFRRRPCRA